MDLSDRIKLLKDQLNDLDVELKNSESIRQKNLDVFQDTRKSLDDPITNEGLRVMDTLFKHVMMSQFEVFRTNSKIVRKISPDAGEYLETKITELEKNNLEFQKLNNSSEVESKQIESLSEEYENLFDEIQNLTKIFRTLINDTIKKFEK